MSLRLPNSVDTPRIELTEWGGCFPERQYYPMVLGNGRDAVLINLMGSGDGFWERPIRSALPLSGLLNVGWYKADRREFAHTNLVYGQLIPFIEFTANPLVRGEVMVPRELSQYFDPKTATVTTLIGQVDHRTEQWLRLRSQTWLTSDGLLVQAITFLEVPDEGAQYQFVTGEPSQGYQNTSIPFVRPHNVSFEAEDDGQWIHYQSQWEQGRVSGFSVVGGNRLAKWRHIQHEKIPLLETEQFSGICRKGDTIWRIVTIQDSKEGDDPTLKCQALRRRIEEEGIEGLRQTHLAEWAAYFATSRVNLPDPSAQYLYEVSRYVIKANLHPSGFLPMGNFPSLWQGAMFWDASFGQMALLGCGNLLEAKSITQHSVSLSSYGKQLAKDLGYPGSRLEWTVNLTDFSKYDPPCFQVHNNAVWAHNIFEAVSYCGERLDETTFAFVEELLVFLVAFLFPGDGSKTALVGVDESYNDPKPKDTWTYAATLKALEDYADYCQRYQQQKKNLDLMKVLTSLRSTLAANTDEHGVLQSFLGGRVPHWGSLVFDLFPDSPAALPTLSKMSQNYEAKRDLFNFHGLNRYAERSFPWANNWVARCLGRMAKPEALHFWLNNTRSINYFGGVPERIFYHGENYIDWCMTGHASQVWAMHAMLANLQGNTLTLLGGIDFKLWPSLEFQNLHTGRGVNVSLILKSERIQNLEIQNICSETIDLSIRIPHYPLEKTISLSPGIHEVVLP